MARTLFSVFSTLFALAFILLWLRNCEKIGVTSEIELSLMNYIHCFADDLFFLLKFIKPIQLMKLTNETLDNYIKGLPVASIYLIDPNRIQVL